MGGAASATTETFKLEVSYKAAELSTPEGAAAEYQNIKEQVAARCEAEHADINFGDDFAAGLCTDRTLGRTVRKIGHPNRTVVHARNN